MTTTEIQHVNFLAKVQEISKKNPKLNLNLIKDLLTGLAQIKSGMVTEYQFE
ncbi:MAG: hypothetical protein NVS3B3_07990 [Aquirhabdus sp.]